MDIASSLFASVGEPILAMRKHAAAAALGAALVTFLRATLMVVVQRRGAAAPDLVGVMTRPIELLVGQFDIPDSAYWPPLPRPLSGLAPNALPPFMHDHARPGFCA